MNPTLGIALGAAVVGLGVAAFLTTKTFEASIAIAASPDKVWSVLMDTERYHEWNPTYVSVSSG